MKDKKAKLCLLVCSHFKKETEAVLQSGDFDDVSLASFPARCGRPSLTWEELTELLEAAGDCGRVEVIGGCCMSEACRVNASKTPERLRLHTQEQCFYLFAGKTLTDHYLKHRSYLMTPGWAARWREHMDVWGFDQAGARLFFAESCAKLVLLDTGMETESSRHLREFAEFTDRPYETVPLGLDHYRLALGDIIQQRRRGHAAAESAAAVNAALREKSDFAMALDLLSQLSQTSTESDIIDKMLNIFIILFAPDVLYYLPVKDGEPGELRSFLLPLPGIESERIRDDLLGMKNKYDRTPSGSGFRIQLEYLGDILGILQVDALKFPEHKNHYLNLALYISDVGGLAVANARVFQEAKKAEGKLAVQVLEMFYQSGEEVDKFTNILELLREFTGVEALGIRLKEDDSFPFHAALGYPSEIMERVPSFCENDCNAPGEEEPVLCMCETVLAGGADPSLPYFSERGGFWTNSVSELSADPGETVLRAFEKSRCGMKEYESVAVVRLRSGGDTIGLLQFSDRRKNMLTPALVNFMEVIGAGLALAIQRRRAEENLILSEAQLRQSQKMEAVGQLAGGVAHDFNNLLTVIRGYCDFLREDLKENQGLYKFVTEIKNAADRAESLTRQLLAFSRKQVMQPRVLDVNLIITTMEDMLGRLIGEDIRLTTRPEPGIGRIEADPGQVEQVIMNLVVNARDAISSGGGTTSEGGKIVIASADVDFNEPVNWEGVEIPSGPYVKLSVSDDGAGMSPEVRDHVFEPFFTTKKEGEGTGLGLSTVYGIVRQSGGIINLYSEPGRGTVFNIYFPRVADSMAGDDADSEITGSLQGGEKKAPGKAARGPA